MKATNEALDAGIAATKPGNTANDVAQKFWGVLDKYEIKKDSRTGYSIGIGYPPDWGERTVSFRKGDKTVLEPNMTFHFMPALWFDDWGLETTESIVITDSGVETLANVPRKLFVKP